MNRVIITDVRYRMSLAVIRSLGRKGIHITAIENDTTPSSAALGFFSRYIGEKHSIPNAAADPEGFIERLVEIAKGSSQHVQPPEELPIILPVGLDSLMAIVRNQDLLKPHALFSVPSMDSLETANDTQRLLKIAEALEIPCPSTTTLAENESIGTLSQRIEYPVVVKYRQGELLKLKPEKRYKIVRTPQQFIDIFTQMHLTQAFPLVQKYISGAGYGVSAVFDRKGEPLEIFCHKRIREYPVTGGPSCYCESIWNDRLVEYAIRLLKALHWQGVAMVEFKGDPDGELCLMEINPRFWGSMPLSVAAKSDIPFALYRAARGETVEKPDYHWYPGRYQLGKKMRFVFQDLLSLPGYLKIRKDKFRFFIGFGLGYLNPNNVDGILEFKDWRPSLAYIRNVFKKAGKQDP